MWNFIKGLYFKLRNTIAYTFVRAVNFSMRLNRGTNDGSFGSFMKKVASFTVFFGAFIGLKLVIGAMLTAVTLALSYVLGATLASLVGLVLCFMFTLDLFQAIDVTRRLENTLFAAFEKA